MPPATRCPPAVTVDGSQVGVCHGLIFSMIYTSKGTFLNLAAPVPERMASIRACLASAGWPELDLAAVLDVEGAWVAGGGGGGAGRG